MPILAVPFAWLGRALAYLWSGWGAIASLLLFTALWQYGADHFGPLVLPQPLAVGQQLGQMLHDSGPWADIAITGRRALLGFLLSLLIGSALGILAGLSMTTAMLSRPIITLLMGIPPIAWLILALLWFGMGDGTPVFTVFIACFPIILSERCRVPAPSTGNCRKWRRFFASPCGCAGSICICRIFFPICFRPGLRRWGCHGKSS
ncbi:MAG: hypothetical protein LRY72_06695 [Saccharospirillaceae bacterium]|nr:hypothetical protein [Saccharospirillaceae bacterium]